MPAVCQSQWHRSAPTCRFQEQNSPARACFWWQKKCSTAPISEEPSSSLVEHDENGTLDLIVYRPSEVRLSDALPDIDEESAAAHRLHYGGPVEPSLIMMLIRSRSAAKGMAHVADSVYISADRRVIKALLAANKPAEELRFYIGYSGWLAGQLDFELERGSWHVLAADPDDVFSVDSDPLWKRLIERLEPEGIEVRIQRRPIS